MKVICIDGKAKISSFNLPEGVPLNARQGVVYEHCYIIEGYHFDPVQRRNVEWGKRRFMPLSNIDEMELLEQREALLQSL